MFEFFKKNKNKDENICKESENISEKSEVLNNQIKLLKDNNWLYSDYKIGNKNILIMDDNESIISTVMDQLYTLDDTSIFNIDDYNIITVYSIMAAFNVIEILEYAPNIEIHFALLDLVIGGKKRINDKLVQYDGLDTAIKIWEKFPNAKILFLSGCIIEPKDDPSNFKERFFKFYGEDMDRFVIQKGIKFNTETEDLRLFFNGF